MQASLRVERQTAVDESDSTVQHLTNRTLCADRPFVHARPTPYVTNFLSPLEPSEPIAAAAPTAELSPSAEPNKVAELEPTKTTQLEPTSAALEPTKNGGAACSAAAGRAKRAVRFPLKNHRSRHRPLLTRQ